MEGPSSGGFDFSVEMAIVGHGRKTDEKIKWSTSHEGSTNKSDSNYMHTETHVPNSFFCNRDCLTNGDDEEWDAFQAELW